MKTKLSLIALSTLSFLISSTSYSHDDKKAPMTTAEQRMKMADAHEKMAVCLKSTRTMDDCHDEMMKACEDNMGKDGCHMMIKHHMTKYHIMKK